MIELKDMNERELLYERRMFERGRSRFSNKELNDEAFRRMKELADSPERKNLFESIKLLHNRTEK